MKRNTENPGRILNKAIDEVRNASVSEEQIERAAARAQQRFQEEYNKVVPHPAMTEVERIQSCDDFRALIPAYLTSSLTPSRRLLFEDHIRECVGCRKVLESRRVSSTLSAPRRPASPSASGSRGLRWVAPIAAILIVAVALQTGPVRDWLWPIDVHAVVQMVDGGLFSVSGHDVQALKVGQRIERGQSVRTSTESGAMLELADGSRIEMASRSELSLVRARDGVKVRLARGNVIVSAAKQHGHLYVETGDCSVAVLGTVFSVSSGVKGSRVTVIEGKVQVRQNDGIERALTPGKQVYTNPSMGAISISEEIGWSRNAEEFLKELVAFGQDFAQRVDRESMRYSSSLIALVPSDTLVFASLPNVSQPFKDSYELFRQRVGENPTLATWWQEADQANQRLRLDEIANRISEVGAYIGPEVILAVRKETTDGAHPMLLAEASRPEVLVSALEGDLRRLAEIGESQFRLARDAAELAAITGPELVIYVGNGLMIASDAAQIQRSVAIRQGTVSSGFAGTPLYSRVDQAYREGVGWLLAVDLRQIVQDEAQIRELGFDNVQQLVLEQKTGIGSAASLVTLGFSQERRGLPAWLGTPSPMGALNFVSPSAYGLSTWITKDPELILDDILGIAQGENDLARHLRAFQESHQIDVRRDLAEPLGNEVLIAIDGPVLPTPSWKVVFEINDGPKIENTIQWAITNLNREALARGLPTWNLESESVDGKMYHALTSTGSTMEIHYTSWMGYMIVAPSRALLAEAIRIHDSGNSINHSAAFRALMPADGRDTASAIMYQNIQAMAQSLPSFATDVASRDLQQRIREASLLQEAVPKVVFVYGESDRITGSAQGSYGLRIASMLGFNHLLGVAGMGPNFLH